MGILSHPGRAVEPPTTSGHPLTGQNQIEFGNVTMRQLGLHIGERIKLGYDPVPITVVGTATLPSFGVVLTDHVSLGRGAMMDEATLLSILRFPLDPSYDQYENAVATPAYPATLIFDLSSRHDAQALARRIIRQGQLDARERGLRLHPASAAGRSGPQCQSDGQSAADVRHRRGDCRDTRASANDPGLGARAAPGPGPAESTGTAIVAAAGRRRLADHHDPGDRGRGRRAARHRRRQLGVDDVRELDRRCAATRSCP